MTTKEIDQKISEERKAFMSQKFTGNIPEWVLEKLPFAIMSLPQPAVPYRAEVVKQILENKSEDLSIFASGLICNIFLACKPHIIDPDINIFLQRRIELEKLREEYTLITGTEERRLGKKRLALENMGGQKVNPVNNGLQKHQ